MSWLDEALGQARVLGFLGRINEPEDVLSSGEYAREPIPKAKQLLDLDAPDAARKRWEWGEKNLMSHEKMETTPTGFRTPLLEGIEEAWDLLNYLNYQMSQDRYHSKEDSRLLWARNDIIHICEILQRIARERGLGKD